MQIEKKSPKFWITFDGLKNASNLKDLLFILKKIFI